MTFPEWWQSYPRKCGKLDAEKAYNAAIKKGATHEQLMVGVQAFAELCRLRGTEKAFIAFPASWLRSGRWDDDDIARIAAPTPTLPLFAIPHPTSWNGTASKLIAEVGQAQFDHWFSDTELDLGPPTIIWARKRSQADWIRNRHRIRLERILGVPEVRVEIR